MFPANSEPDIPPFQFEDWIAFRDHSEDVVFANQLKGPFRVDQDDPLDSNEARTLWRRHFNLRSMEVALVDQGACYVKLRVAGIELQLQRL